MAEIRFRRSAGIVGTLALVGTFGTAIAILAADRGSGDRGSGGRRASEPPPAPTADIAGYKTTQAAKSTKIDALGDVAALAKAGYLGISTDADAKGRLTVSAVALDSPALKAGIQVGDVLLKIDGKAATSRDELRELIEAKPAGEVLKLSLRRKEKELELSPELIALAGVGRKPPEPRAILGVRVSEPRSGDGGRIEEFTSDSPAEKAGLKVGDLILQVDGARLGDATTLGDLLAGKKPADTVKLGVRRDGKELEIKAQLAAESIPDPPATDRGGAGRGFGRGGQRGPRPPMLNKPGVLRVAVVGIEFPDLKHNEKISPKDWENEFFSRQIYTSANVTGQQVYGSLNDYYVEQSSGAMRVEGQMCGWIEVGKNRMEYSPTPTPPVPDKDKPKSDEKKPVDKKSEDGGRKSEVGGQKAEGKEVSKADADKDGKGKPGAEKGSPDKTAAAQDPNRPRGPRDGQLLREVLDKLVARDGKDALDGYDAVFFIYAGKRAARTIDSVYWPHMSRYNYQSRQLRYFIAEEGADRMTNISVFCHETGHIFGLPDLYIRRQETQGGPGNGKGNPNPSRYQQNPYAESLWYWDIMAVQVNNGRPQHMSAWSKEQLGWIKPVVIDPRVRQKLVLSPIENSPNECIKIPVRLDGSEYFLLENRRQTGFDASVPAEGLLIWRVVYGRPILEAAHGVAGSTGIRSDVKNVPFPIEKNDSFTPYTKPSSAALTGDELPVYITNIRRLADGRITLNVGYGFD